MLAGKRFKLERATLGVGHIEGKRRAVTVPVGATLNVVSGPNREGMLNVDWDGQVLEMFAVDVDVRGTEIKDQSAKA
jgi:hypothetical protein